MTPAPAKKILFVITKSNWGGAQRYVYDLATHVSGAVVALGGSGPLKDKLAAAGVRVEEVRSFQRDISFAKELRAFFELLRIMRAERPDVIHLNSSKAGGIGALAGRIAGVPKIVFTAHGWPFLEPRNFLSRALIYFFSWLTAALSHTVIVVSESDLRIARKMPFVKDAAIRIYNGIDLGMPFGSGDAVRRQFPSHAKITGTIGELTKNKNQEALINEAAKRQDMFVAIVGEGEDRGRLEWQIKMHGLENRVKLFGFMPAAEVLKGFDEFALPSLKEGLPYVLLEAKLAGLPLRANRVGGVGEILDAKDMSEFSLERMVRETLEIYSS